MSSRVNAQREVSPESTKWPPQLLLPVTGYGRFALKMIRVKAEAGTIIRRKAVRSGEGGVRRIRRGESEAEVKGS